jgi:hypothetical protein
MEQSAATPTAGAAEEEDRAFAAIVAAVERLDELGLTDEDGRAVIEPASTFTWS